MESYVRMKLHVKDLKHYHTDNVYQYTICLFFKTEA